jgi:hypothetical protein
MTLDGPDRLWGADITYVTIAGGFVYLAAIIDAWSRRVPNVQIRSPAGRCHGNYPQRDRSRTYPSNVMARSSTDWRR